MLSLISTSFAIRLLVVCGLHAFALMALILRADRSAIPPTQAVRMEVRSVVIVSPAAAAIDQEADTPVLPSPEPSQATSVEPILLVSQGDASVEVVQRQEPAPESKPEPKPKVIPLNPTVSQTRSNAPAPADKRGVQASSSGSSEPIMTAARFDAAYLHNPPPVYPSYSKRMKEQGTVLLLVQVDTNGNPDRVVLHKGSGFPALDEAALDAVRRWRFVPAKRGDTPVAAPVIVPIHFTR